MDNKNLSTTEAIEFLNRHLLIYAPEDYVLQYIQTVRDVYEHRTILKEFNGTDQIISHLAQIIIQEIKIKGRMRTLDCLKVLRALTKQIDPSDLLPSTIQQLFKIYKNFIFRNNEEVQWCVSAILKDKPLSDEAINWLILNSDKSYHIVNRLLLYPNGHPAISSWGEQVYQNNCLPSRRSELIALFLTPTNADSLVQECNEMTFMWAIYKARIPTKQKIALLKKYCSMAAFNSVVDISDRLQAPEVLKYFLKKLIKQETANQTIQATGRSAGA